MKINQQVLELFGKKLGERIESKEFVEFMEQTEAGNETLTRLKKEYLNENKFPSQTNITDLMWDVVATVYAPYVEIGDAVLNMVGSDTFPDSKSLLTADFKTFYNFALNLIGKGVEVKVSTNATVEESSKEESENIEVLTTYRALNDYVGAWNTTHISNDYLPKATEFTMRYGNEVVMFRNDDPFVVLNAASQTNGIGHWQRQRVWEELMDEDMMIDKLVKKASFNIINGMLDELRQASVDELNDLYTTPNGEEFINRNFQSPFDAVLAVTASPNYDLTEEFAILKDGKIPISMGNSGEYQKFVMDHAKEIVKVYVKCLNNSGVSEYKKFVESMDEE